MTWPQISLDTEKDRDMCFACGRNNPIGLKLVFRPDGDVVRTEFTPTRLYQGWGDIVHGGIIHCLLDEALSYAAILNGLFCLTAKMESRLRQPAKIGEPLTIAGAITKFTKRLVETEANVSLGDGTVIAEAKGTLFVIRKIQKGDTEYSLKNDVKG